MKLYSPSEIREIRDRFGFRNSKSLGQNFLTDKNIIDRIIEGSGIGPEDLVIEIGPGIGVITREAAQAAKKVIAVEIDTDLLPVLQYTLGDLDNVEVVNQDILKTDLKELIADEDFSGKVRVIGNLPYYITTPIIMKLLEEDIGAETITVMMQKEVADRLIADPGSKVYGAASVSVQYYSRVTRIADVSKDSFMPQPKVDSAVLRLDVREEPAVHPMNEKHFFGVVRTAFSQKRKTLLNSLGATGASKEVIRESLEEAGIDEKRRAETLSLEDFARVSDALENRGF